MAKANTDKLTIAIFHFAFFYSGGGEKLVIKEAIGLSKLGHNVTVWAPIVDTRRCFPDLMGKIDVYPIFPQLPNWVPKRLTLQLLATCVLFPLVSFRYRKVDVIFAANQPSLYFGWLVKKLWKIPYVGYLAQPLRLLYPRKVDLDTGFFLREKMNFLPILVKVFRGFIKFVDTRSVGQASKVLVNGQYSRKMIAHVYGVVGTVCTAASDRSGKIVRFAQRIKKPYILLTNRHFPQKRFEYAISVLPDVVTKYPEVKLVITGAATLYTQYLSSLVSQLGLAKYVVFTGLVSERKLNQLYRGACVYVYTAPEEDFGMGIVESMWAATPVVAWNSGGPSYILRTGGGILVDPPDISEFGKAILKVLTQRKLWRTLSAQGLKSAHARFSYSAHVKIIEQAMYQATRC